MNTIPLNAKPLSAAHFKSAVQGSIVDGPVVTKLVTKLVESFSSALAGFGTSPPRVSLEGVSETVPSPHDDGTEWFRLCGQQGAILIQISLDKPAVFAMCELALGGTGTDEMVTITDRPLSGIEIELRRAIVSRLATAASTGFSQVLAAPFTVAEIAPADVPEQTVSSARVTVRCLLNIFSYSGELRVMVSRDDLIRLLGEIGKPPSSEEETQSQRNALQNRISTAVTTLQVSLASETVHIEDLARLRPGSLLKLRSTMSTPVIVSSGGVEIFSAALVHSVDRLSVQLAGALQ